MPVYFISALIFGAFYYLAPVDAELGDKDNAVQCLENAYRAHEGRLMADKA